MRYDNGQHPAAGTDERCVCSDCGAHQQCTVGLATIGGLCTVCGGMTMVPLERRTLARSRRHFAVASVAELDVMSDSGYGGIVLDRMAEQVADIFAVDESCIFARDPRDADMTIVVAAHGPTEDSIGKRLDVSAERAVGARVAGAAVELCWEGEVQGALSVSCETTVRQFSPAELEVLGSLGVIAAAAVSHAHARLPRTGDIRGPIRALSKSLAEFDAATAQHSDDVVETALELGKTAGFGLAAMAELGVAALLHDIGKVRVPDSILKKPGALTPSEHEVMAQHPVLGADALARVPGLEVVATLVRYHHERWDGEGYPDGLSGARIPLASRIVAACDAYCAMTSDRPYRKAMSHDRAIDELRAGAGWQFDPAVVADLEAMLTRAVPV
jgi:HD-GYP domain-containing protein (c-di-GMP phosphodiesterase class II)